MKEGRDGTEACIYTLQASGLCEKMLFITGADVRSEPKACYQ